MLVDSIIEGIACRGGTQEDLTQIFLTIPNPIGNLDLHMCDGVFYNYMVCTLFFDRFFVGVFEGRVMKVQKYICRFNWIGNLKILS